MSRSVRGSPRKAVTALGIFASFVACLPLAPPALAWQLGTAVLEFTDVRCGGNGTVTAVYAVTSLPAGRTAAFTRGRTVTLPVAVGARNLVTASVGCTYHWLWVRWTQRTSVAQHVDVRYSGQVIRL